MSLSGSVKNFNADKGFGFIVGADGKDIFLHIKSCTDGKQPQKGDVVSYDLQPSNNKPGEMQAANVTGGTAVPWGTPVQGTGAHSAPVKRFNPTKGFGFIDNNGTDVFFHVKACVGTMPYEGETVQFDIEDSKNNPGKVIAINVTGGTCPLPSGDMKGMGKGGPYGGWGGDAWGGDSWGGGGGWGGDSWGKGGGKGKGGKGKGGDKGGGKGGGKWGGGGGWGGDSWGGKGW